MIACLTAASLTSVVLAPSSSSPDDARAALQADLRGGGLGIGQTVFANILNYRGEQQLLGE